MTNKEAKVYIQYIKVLLDIVGRSEDILIEALNRADEALGSESLYDDPRFATICHEN